MVAICQEQDDPRWRRKKKITICLAQRNITQSATLLPWVTLTRRDALARDIILLLGQTAPNAKQGRQDNRANNFSSDNSANDNDDDDECRL
jgi:hypothetical protein